MLNKVAYRLKVKLPVLSEQIDIAYRLVSLNLNVVLFLHKIKMEVSPQNTTNRKNEIFNGKFLQCMQYMFTMNE